MDRANLRSCIVAKVDHHLVNKTPTPSLWRVVALDDLMSSVVIMLRRVAACRLIATTDVAACTADAKMEPGRASREAFFAAARFRTYFQNFIRVAACTHAHVESPRLLGASFGTPDLLVARSSVCTI